MSESTTAPSSPQLLLAAKQDRPILYRSILAELLQLIKDEKFDVCLTRCLDLVRQYPLETGFRLLLGISAKKMKQHDLATAAFLAILKQEPDHIDALIELSGLYHQLNQYADALHYLEHAFKINGQLARITKDLSIIYYEYGCMDKAMHYYNLTHALDTKNELQYGPALIQLAQGDYQQGWQSYEYRLQKPGKHLLPLHLPTPIWDGKADLTGKKLVLLWEQGYGDNIQFIRFASKLGAYHPKKIYVICPNDIASLFNELPNIEVIGVNFASSFDIPAHDYQLNIPSLPYVLGINDESKFLSQPYLDAPKAKKLFWQNHITKNKHLRVGFCWAGNPTHVANSERSCGLSFFMPLLAYHHISWYSLQKFPTEDELQILNYSGIANIGSACTDFADTAAVIGELDLVLSVDTATAHLAGAMGKPVWLLMRYQTEWRHPRGRPTSPWYPSMRLMRQAKPGDWDSVLHQVEAELESHYHLAKIDGT